MIRRIHVSLVHPGEIGLDDAETHHAMDVLRLSTGTPVEVFDDEGHVAAGTLSVVSSGVVVKVETMPPPVPSSTIQLSIAAAVPKGDRADWMVQKLSELGVRRFIPLVSARSVVVPAGKNKAARWARLAVEAAKQSRREGVMKIEKLSRPPDVIGMLQTSGHLPETAWYLSTRPDAQPIMQILHQEKLPDRLTMLIGPEGGWTEQEMNIFEEAGIMGVSLTNTVLRVETAAIAAASVVICWQG